MENKKVINIPESILLVSSFFMFLFISKFMVFIPEIKYFFERDSLWFILPLSTLALAIYSYMNRKN